MEKGKDMMNEQCEGSALFSIAIMVLTAVVWMSLDIYLPALPVLQEEFSVSASYLNLTLTVGRAFQRQVRKKAGIYAGSAAERPVYFFVYFCGRCRIPHCGEGCCRIGERDNTDGDDSHDKGFVFGDKVQEYHDGVAVGRYSGTDDSSISGIFYHQPFQLALAVHFYRGPVGDPVAVYRGGQGNVAEGGEDI